MAKSDTTTKPKRTGRIKQIREAFTMTRQADPRITWILLGIFVVVFGVILGIGFIIGEPIWLGILGFLIALTVAFAVFGRRAQKAAYASVAGQPGAAAAVMETMRGGWTVTPAVAVNKQSDLVHRVVGRAGLVLVGEGDESRVATMLANEKRRHQRFVPEEIPITEVSVGEGSGQVPLAKLQRKMLRLKTQLKGAQVTDLNYRMRALGSMQNNLPIPKGPMPKRVQRR